MAYINKTYLSTQFTNFASRVSAVFLKKSNVTSKGSATQPVYFDANGVAQNTTYTLGKSVPSNAVFTDTKYTFETGTQANSFIVKENGVAQTVYINTSPLTWIDAT